MSWLTQAELRRDTPQARQLADQLQHSARKENGHGLVWTLFSSDPEARRDFLYRTVELGRFIIVSEREPEDRLGLWTLRSRPYAPQVRVGGRYGFSLCANPTVAVSRPDRARSHRADVLMNAKMRAKAEGKPFTLQDQRDAAQAWLLGREDRLGVRFDRAAQDDEDFGGVQVGRVDRVDLSRPGAAKRANLTAVDYLGVLTVVDPERLLPVLTGGVGRGKAFGLGLMLLRHLDG